MYTVPLWAFAVGCGVFVAAGVGLFFVFVAMLRG